MGIIATLASSLLTSVVANSSNNEASPAPSPIIVSDEIKKKKKGEAIKVIAKKTSHEHAKTGQILTKVLGHPIKMVASFIFAPFLMIKIVLKVKNPIRRTIAVIGLTTALIAAYISGTYLGTLAGAAVVASHIGIFAAIGFLIGTSMSMILSVIFSIFVFNLVSFVFLKMNSDEVLRYLDEVSS